jgi:hypothetical protein
MAEYDELVEILIHLLTQRLEPKFQFTRGLLGDGNGNVDVPDREGFSFVRPDRGSNKILEIFNKQAFAADGTPILIGEIPWQPGLQQVLGVDWDTYLTVGWENRFAGLAQHGETHVWRDDFIGEDPFSIYRRQIFDLRTEPIGSGSSSVLVTPYGLNDGGIFKTWPGSPGIDLSGAIPSATGTVRNVLVYWNFTGTTAYGSLGVASGTTTTVSDTIVPPKPAGPISSIPSGFVKLQGGQTQITEEDITDARPLFTPVGGDDLARVSKVYRSTFESVALQADADGDIGIGTDTIPHGGIGWAKLALDGVDFDEDGPHVQATTDADDFPVMQYLHWGHDDMWISFDAYYDGAWKSSDSNGNFQIGKENGRFRIKWDTGIAQGGGVVWNQGIILDDNGRTGFGTISPAAHIESVSDSVAQLRLSHTFNSKFTDFTVDTNHDLTIDPSSTGLIKLNSTVTIIDEIQHEGDLDTKIGFTDDKVSVDAGGLNMLALTETTQDLVEIGDVAGGGDVDINFNSGQMFFQGSNNFLGIGTIIPGAPIEIQFETQSAAVSLKTFHASVGSTFLGQTARGSIASPTAITNNGILMRFSAGGYDGSNFSSAQAAIDMIASQTFTASAQGTRIVFRTTLNGTTSMSERVRIADDGNVGINGVTSPSTELDIGAGAIEFDEMTAPGGGAVNTARLYAVDNGAGKTQLAVVFNTGAVQILAVEP